MFKSTHYSLRYEINCEWVFFSEHSVYELMHCSSVMWCCPKLCTSCPSCVCVMSGDRR